MLVGERDFFFPPKCPYQPCSRYSILLNTYWGSDLKVKWPGHETDPSPPSSAYVENEWGNTFRPHIWHRVVYRETYLTPCNKLIPVLTGNWNKSMTTLTSRDPRDLLRKRLRARGEDLNCPCDAACSSSSKPELWPSSSLARSDVSVSMR